MDIKPNGIEGLEFYISEAWNEVNTLQKLNLPSLRAQLDFRNTKEKILKQAKDKYKALRIDCEIEYLSDFGPSYNSIEAGVRTEY